jgi:hypothetical protein
MTGDASLLANGCGRGLLPDRTNCGIETGPNAGRSRARPPGVDRLTGSAGHRTRCGNFYRNTRYVEAAPAAVSGGGSEPAPT